MDAQLKSIQEKASAGKVKLIRIALGWFSSRHRSPLGENRCHTLQTHHQFDNWAFINFRMSNFKMTIYDDNLRSRYSMLQKKKRWSFIF